MLGATTRKELSAATSAAAEALDLQELAERPLTHLARAVSASAAALYRYEAGGNLEVIGGDFAPALRTYSPDLWRSDPTQQEPHALPPTPRVVLPRRMVKADAFRRCEAYEVFYRPHDVDDLMCLWLTNLPHGAAGMVGLVLTRPSGLPSFGRDELKVACSALAAFATAVERQRRIERKLRAYDGAQAIALRVAQGAYAAVDADGRLLASKKLM